MANTTRRWMLLGSLAVPFLQGEDHGKPAKPEVKPEAKPQPKHEAKPAAKPEAKHEAKHEAKPAAKPSAFGDHKEPSKAAPPAAAKPVVKSRMRHAARAQPEKPAGKAEHGEERPAAPVDYPVPGDMLPELVAGNRRFASGRAQHPRQNAVRIAEAAARPERPRACIVTCADSRLAPELIFDQGIGDLHTIRVAGNVANHDQIASLELILQETNVAVCVVLGHSGCGTVSAVVEDRRFSPNVQAMLKPVANAVSRTRKYNPSLKGAAFVEECVRVNVWQSVEDLLRGSEVIATRVRTGILKMAGAVYHTDTGVVEWLGAYPGALSILR